MPLSRPGWACLALLSALVVTASAPSSTSVAGERTDYTGFWKRSCSDAFGVQIQRVDGALYSVSFCGPGGCFKPGEWTPNTPIEGDPRYRMVSLSELGIRRTEAGTYSTYLKCETDPAWIVTPSSAELEEIPDCARRSAPEKGVLIAWIAGVRRVMPLGTSTESATTTVEPFRPVALLEGPSLRATAGAGIAEGQSFWPVLESVSTPRHLSSVGSFLDHVDEDWEDRGTLVPLLELCAGCSD